MMTRREAIDVYAKYMDRLGPLPPFNFRGGVVWADVVREDGPFADYAEAEIVLDRVNGVFDEDQ